MEKVLTLVDQAIIFAAKAHAGAVRKGSKVPYIVHPIEAAAIVAGMTDDPEVIAAAVLHDVLEDTETTEEELLARFGHQVKELVMDASEDKRKHLPASLTWKTRKQETLTFLETRAGRDAKMVALGDKLSNLRAIHRDLCMLGDAVWDRFNEKDKSMHAWMYRAVAEILKEDFGGHPAWKEYDCLVRTVFGG